MNLLLTYTKYYIKHYYSQDHHWRLGLITSNEGLPDKIEKVQRHFTKRIYGLSTLSYEDRLLSLKLDSLHVRRIKQDLVMCYKIVYGLVSIDCSDFCHLSTVIAPVGIIKNCIYKTVALRYVNLAVLGECVLCGTVYLMRLFHHYMFIAFIRFCSCIFYPLTQNHVYQI